MVFILREIFFYILVRKMYSFNIRRCVSGEEVRQRSSFGARNFTMYFYSVRFVERQNTRQNSRPPSATCRPAIRIRDEPERPGSSTPRAFLRARRICTFFISSIRVKVGRAMGSLLLLNWACETKKVYNDKV